jgi:Sec-independent protein translocase protein TatA
MTDVLLVLLVILGAVIVIRGPKTLPKLGEALGRGVKAARDEVKDGESTDDPSAPPPTDTR